MTPLISFFCRKVKIPKIVTSQTIFLIFFSVFIFPVNAEVLGPPLKVVSLEEAKSLGVVLDITSFKYFFVKLRIEQKFPCTVDEVSVSAYHKGEMILSSSINPRNRIYSFLVARDSLEQAYVYISCANSSRNQYSAYGFYLKGASDKI
jgi:hypothetical protein